MRMHVVLAVVGFSLGLSAPAAADPAYNAADIVSLFAAEAETGATRGICIGTEAECGGATAEVDRPARPSTCSSRSGSNSDQLTPEAQQNLDEFAKALLDPRLNAATFAVEGHTDASGTDEYNMTLSRAPRRGRRELPARKGRRFGEARSEGLRQGAAEGRRSAGSREPPGRDPHCRAVSARFAPGHDRWRDASGDG